MRYLKQSTAVTVTVGPTIDEVDFITPITSLTHAGIVAGLIKGTTNTAITVTASAGVNDLVHILAGHHSLELTTGNTDTVGHLRIHLSDADSFLPVWEDFMVVEEQVFDSLHGAGDVLDVNVASTDTDAITATSIAAGAIGSSELAANAIGSSQLANGAITAAKFGASAIDNTVLAANAIGSSQLASDAIGSTQLATSAVNEIRDSIISDATTFAGANINATISSRATPAQVNTEVLDVMQTDTFAQVGQELPAATQSILKMVQFLYKAWRNKSDQTASDYQLYNDAGSTVDQQTTVTDDATTFTRNVIASGP